MTEKKQVRAILPILKARVVDRGPGYFKIHIGGSTTITVGCHMEMLDVRDGDLLQLYTEVLIKPAEGPGNA